MNILIVLDILDTVAIYSTIIWMNIVLSFM